MATVSKPEKPILALLQWIGGEFDGALTVGVPIDWVLNFDHDTFDPDDEDNSYVVEWRETKNNKKPKKGYNLYDARVLKISRSLKSLKQHAAMLDGLISPLRPERTLQAIRNNFKKSAKRNLENELDDPEFQKAGPSGIQAKISKKNKKNQYVEEPMDDGGNNLGADAANTGTQPERGSKRGIKRGVGAKGNAHDGNCNGVGVGADAEVRNGRNDAGARAGTVNGPVANGFIDNGPGGNGRIDNRPGGNEPGGNGLGDNLDGLENELEENDNGGGITNEQIHRVNEVRGFREAQAVIAQGQGNNNQNRQPDPNDLVELGKAGSNIFVQRCQWDTADSQSTFQGMGRSLVQALFPDEVLLRSNYRGGSSKIVKNAAKRPSLDSGIMKAIKESVMQKFPNDFKQVLFGMAINNVMTELRRQNKLAEEVEVQEEAE